MEAAAGIGVDCGGAVWDVGADAAGIFCVTVVKKAAFGMAPEEALEWIAQWAEFPCQSVDAKLMMIAAEMAERYRISYWDGAILAAAEALGAGMVYSEDLSDGKVRVVNPFAAPYGGGGWFCRLERAVVLSSIKYSSGPN
jgi:uncharacterized membrane protein YgdD (TMEM256/DUF423 family)